MILRLLVPFCLSGSKIKRETEPKTVFSTRSLLKSRQKLFWTQFFGRNSLNIGSRTKSKYLCEVSMRGIRPVTYHGQPEVRKMREGLRNLKKAVFLKLRSHISDQDPDSK